MELSTRDIVMKKLLDSQENVRDYESFSKQISDSETETIFKEFAEQSGEQAKKLQQLINKFDQ